MTTRTTSRLTFVALTITATLATGCRGASDPAPATTTAAVPAAAPDRVTLTPQARVDAGIAVETLRAVDRADGLDAPGVLAIDETRTSRIGSMVEGNVVRTLVEVGDRVRSGALLAEMHSHVVHDAWADYRRAIADRTRLENELAYAKEADARAGRLIASKAISQQERERAAANRVAAEQQLDMARTEVRRGEEALEHLGVTNGEDPTGESGEQIPVRAPIAGVVLERMVSQGTAATPGAPLFVVSDLSALWALAEVDEQHLATLAVGRPVSIRVSAFPDQPFAGTIGFIADSVAEKTRRVVVRCAVPNRDGRLKPGMFATVTLTTGETRPMLMVPTTAVQEIGDRRVVFVEEAGNAFAARTVTVGREAGAQVEVVHGLKEGDRIVTAGSFLLKSELLESITPSEG